MLDRLNNSESCICCARRSDGLAVGMKGRWGWYCLECGPTTAWKVLHMVPQNMDAVEHAACLKVADMVEGDLNVPSQELPAFIAWCVKQFANAMREQFDGKS